MRQFSAGRSPDDYLYDTSLQPSGTLCLYHPHIHGLGRPSRSGAG